MSAAAAAAPKSTLKARALCSLVASVLLVIALYVPIWQMTLRAPQYPAGLRLVAYGTEITGDLREINIINHYIGMGHIAAVPAPEMSLFPFLIAGLVVSCWLALLHRRLAQLAIIANIGAPFVILGDMQLWLHTFGRNLDPAAPIDVDPFTPMAIGVSTIGNFQSMSWASWGFFAMLGAAALMVVSLRIGRRGEKSNDGSEDASTVSTGSSASAGSNASNVAGTTETVLAAFLVFSASAPASEAASASAVHWLTLQERVDQAAPGSRVEVNGGIHHGPITVRGPLTLVGIGAPVIEGTGVGSVVTILGDGVTLEGFTIRNSGRAVTEEAAGIKVKGSRHTIRSNLVEDVYFGIHLADGGDNVIEANRITPGQKHGARPGHAISLWHQRGVVVRGNWIREARDGIYMTFADDVLAENNDVRGCRYGVHSMYSENSRFVGNRLEDNLLGANLMYSNGLEMRCNMVLRNRQGATAYGVLLKDIDDLLIEDNSIIGNRVGIYADSTPLGVGHEAIVRNNLIAGNDSALALQGTVRLTFYDNRVVSNLTDVRAEGSVLSDDNKWSVDGRGNYWDAYGGYDSDGDGIGDIPYRYELVMNEFIRKTPKARAFVYTPASMALERAARLFPVYRPKPLLVDPHPLMNETILACGEAGR